MIDRETLCLQSDAWPGQLANRALLSSLEGFAPRSCASEGIALDPEATIQKVVSLFEGYELVWADRGKWHENLVLRKEDHLLFAEVRRGHAELQIFARSEESRKILESLLSQLQTYKFQNKEEDGVWAEFFHMSKRNGVVRTTHFLRCPSWEEIRGNYPTCVREGLQRLFTMSQPWTHGRLIIWHGPPGTGKTYAIRSLMMQWRDGFDYIVVNDPERLAGDPGYYYEVASESGDLPRRFRRLATRHLDNLQEGEDDDDDGEKRRRVFILEDTADLIIQESRSTHFDKIGKLLNMTDGLFGQGREDIFLLTFNEEVDRIDPAFLRPGRCIAKVEFGRFQPEEAFDWFRAHKVHPSNAAGEMTLAEMYARRLGREEEGMSHGSALRSRGFSRRK